MTQRSVIRRREGLVWHSARSYDAEQTNRVSSWSGDRGAHHDAPIHTAGVCVMSCSVAISSSAHRLGAVAAAHVLVRCPVFGVAYTEVCNSAFVKDVALVSHCVPGSERGTGKQKRGSTGTVPLLLS